jgi:hypothetical protein
VVEVTQQRRVQPREPSAEPEGLVQVRDLAPLRRDAAALRHTATVTKLECPPQTCGDGAHLLAGLERHAVRVHEDARDTGVGEQAAHLSEGKHAERVDVHGAAAGEQGLMIDGHDDVGTLAVSLGCAGRAERDIAHLDQGIGGDLLGAAPVPDRDLRSVRTPEALDRRRHELRIHTRQTGGQVEHPVVAGGHPHRPARPAHSLLDERLVVTPLGEDPATVRGERHRVERRGDAHELGLQRFRDIAIEVAQQVRGELEMPFGAPPVGEDPGELWMRLGLTRGPFDAAGLRRGPVQILHQLVGGGPPTLAVGEVATVRTVSRALGPGSLADATIDRPDQPGPARREPTSDHVQSCELGTTGVDAQHIDVEPDQVVDVALEAGECGPVFDGIVDGATHHLALGVLPLRLHRRLPVVALALASTGIPGLWLHDIEHMFEHQGHRATGGYCCDPRGTADDNQQEWVTRPGDGVSRRGSRCAGHPSASRCEPTKRVAVRADEARRGASHPSASRSEPTKPADPVGHPRNRPRTGNTQPSRRTARPVQAAGTVGFQDGRCAS